MDQFTNGELKPSEDPSMMQPLQASGQASEAGEKEISTGNNAVKKGSLTKRTVDEFTDVGGLHYKGNIVSTSKTPGLNPSKHIGANSAARRASIGDMPRDISKMSLNFGGGAGSRSNLSSIVHMEEVSAGYMSIDRQEYRLQSKRITSRSI